VQYVDNSEMNEILNDRELLQNLQNGLKDLKARDYKIV